MSLASSHTRMASHKTLVYHYLSKCSTLVWPLCMHYHEPSSSGGHNCTTTNLMDWFFPLDGNCLTIHTLIYSYGAMEVRQLILDSRVSEVVPRRVCEIINMASLSSSTVAAVSGAVPAQATMVAPFTGLKSNVGFPATRKAKNDFSSLPSNGGRVQCMKVWPPTGLKKYETLSYLPPLPEAALAKEVDYLLRKGWIPCLEFELFHGFVYRENHRSPGYYDGRYWTMWKLPMYGCTDSAQVIQEVNECKKEYPNSFIRIIGFDNVRQVQCISFIAHKPPGY